MNKTKYIENNICLLSDSYKMWHYKGYLPNTTHIYSYLEARKGAKYDKVLFYGLQYVIKKYLVGNVVTQQKIDEAKKIIDEHLGEGVFNYDGWKYILDKYEGKLPVRIKAVKEGTVLDINNALMTVENTDPNVPWLTNYLETILMHTWYAMTVATEDNITRKEMEKRYIDPNSVDFALHGFGFRACTSVESCGVADSAHLINFKGTDSVPALTFIKNWYNTEKCMGFSVAATEHSIMTARCEDGEWDVVDHLFEAQKDGILSIVIDSYDWKRFIDVMGSKYNEKIMNRNGRIVFRPDSGDPFEVIDDIIERLGMYFGFTKVEHNGKTLRLLDDHVRILWGDGIDGETAIKILDHVMENGWAADNIVFGEGGHMVQSGKTRDTMRFAFKCSSTCYDGEWHDVYKKPLDITKASKRGRLALIFDDATKKYVTVKEDELNGRENLLETVFENGELKREQTFEEIQTIAKK